MGTVSTYVGEAGMKSAALRARSKGMRTCVLFLWALLSVCVLPVQAQTIEYVHTDALGTPVAITNAAGQVIELSEYEPYGKLANRPLTDGPGFTGHVQDATTGLTYMQQRYYDPGIGKMLSVDPVTAYSSGDMRHFNVYAYAYNNPYVFNDPDGEKGKVGWAVELGAGTMRKISRVTLEQAVKIRRAGRNFLGDSTRISRRVETTAHGRAGRIRHDGHELKDESGSTAGRGLPHYQSEGVTGHSFMDKAGGLAAAALAFGAMQLENNAKVADKVAETADLFDPFMIGEAGAGSDCAEGCGSSHPGGDIKSNGFKGVFRVDGRIDAKKLDRELEKEK